MIKCTCTDHIQTVDLGWGGYFKIRYAPIEMHIHYYAKRIIVFS